MKQVQSKIIQRIKNRITKADMAQAKIELLKLLK